MTPKKIYVAAGFPDWARARAFILRCEAEAGLSCSFDWTQNAERVLVHRSSEDMKVEGRNDTNGVLDAGILALMLGGVRRGGYMEFGSAAMAGKPCLLIGTEPGMAECPFYYLPNVIWCSHEEEALMVLRNLTNNDKEL
jgi:hypothetical protein